MSESLSTMEIDLPPVEHETGAGHGRFFIDLGDGFEAEMTYRKMGQDVIVIDHTYTPPEFRGRNIAARLMLRAIDEARTAGLKIVPHCSYAAAQFRRHAEWADLLAQ
jgi:predicted GNAT family acetyltransferase